MAQVKLLIEHITIAMFISWLCFCVPQGRMISLGNPLISLFFLENPVPMSELWPTVICTKYAVRICSRCHIICCLILGFTMMVYFLVTLVTLTDRFTVLIFLYLCLQVLNMYPEFCDYFWSNLEITFNLRDVCYFCYSSFIY